MTPNFVDCQIHTLKPIANIWQPIAYVFCGIDRRNRSGVDNFISYSICGVGLSLLGQGVPRGYGVSGVKSGHLGVYGRSGDGGRHGGFFLF